MMTHIPEPSISETIVIETNRLSISYADKVALQNVSLRVPCNSVVAIIGPSGCGKSSFLYALNRLVDMVPNCRVDGSVRIQRQDIYSHATNPLELRRRVGLITQKPTPFPLSIRKNIQLALKEQRTRNREELESTTKRVLQDTGLWEEVKDRLDSSALKLSGGQQQRLCIARALALEPEILLFDEPCSALDPISTSTIEKLIRSLRQRTTIVIATHNLAQARRIADSVAMFWSENGEGWLVEYGTADKVFSDPESPVTAAYIKGLSG